MLKLVFMFPVALFLLLTLLVSTCPADSPPPDDWTESSTSVVLGQRVTGDFFAVDEVVDIAGVVEGDVYAAGRLVRVSGTVTGDLIAAAEALDITGLVNQDVRVAGRQVTITGSIGKNVTALAETFEVTTGASVGGSLLGAAQTVVLSGPVGLDARLAAASVRLDSRIGGKVDAMTDLLVVTADGTVERSLTYWSRNEATVDPGATIGGILSRREPPRTTTGEADDSLSVVGALMFKAISFGAMLLSGLLFIHLFPNFARQAADTVGRRTLSSLGLGFVALVVVPAAAIMLFITVVGIPLALLVMMSYAVGLYLVRMFAALWLGRALLARKQNQIGAAWAYVLGLAVLFAFSLLPYAGFIVQAGAVLLGLGAVLITKKNVYDSARRSGLL
jgi:cytoskeletal protein CcmA (bactofilin family)